MRRGRYCAVWLLTLVFSVIVAAQEPTLTKDSEASFRRLMRMAQEGRLGTDVINANIALNGAEARLELVRRDEPGKVLVLSPRRSAQSASRFFEIVAGEHATAADVANVGRALDECFRADPFQFAGLEESVDLGPTPGFAEAWSEDGWRGVWRALERRVMMLASLERTVAIIGVLVLGFAISITVLWTARPSRTM